MQPIIVTESGAELCPARRIKKCSSRSNQREEKAISIKEGVLLLAAAEQRDLALTLLLPLASTAARLLSFRW